MSVVVLLIALIEMTAVNGIVDFRIVFSNYTAPNRINWENPHTRIDPDHSVL